MGNYHLGIGPGSIILKQNHGDRGEIGILTYHHIANNGAALFAYSLCKALKERLPEFDVGLINYQSRELRLNELFKQTKLYRKEPFFNLYRHRKFKKFLAEELFIARESKLITDANTAIHLLNAQKYKAIITAMDVWNINNIRSLPKFPNIYWLPEPIRAKKIAYAVSGYRSNNEMVKANLGSVKSLLNSFDLIGVRDEYTRNMVQESGVRAATQLELVPDPTFLYRVRETGAGEVLRKTGIELNKPILGILVYGKREFSRQIRAYYKPNGFQIVALSMYNPFADVNLGHILDPHEWAEAFNYFSFCITDRFHGAIFCLKNKIPFVAIEPDRLSSLKHSKLYSLLNEFELLDCYMDLYQEEFRIGEFFERGERLMGSWDNKYLPGIVKKLNEMKERNFQFIQQIRGLLIP